MNGLKTALLLGLTSSLLVVGGGAMGGRRGIWMGLAFAVAMNFFSYFFSEKLALASHRAQPLTPESAPQLYARVAPMTESLCQRMGIPMPKLWLLPDPSPNAFATGRNPQNASVAVTHGLVQLMNNNELEGVIAHELAHVKHRDILISSIAATIGGAITALAHFGMFFGGSRDDDDGPSPITSLLMIFVGPIAAGLIQMAVSRTREFAADAGAAQACGSPNGLASALGKLEGWSKRIPMDTNPASAHMFIINPFSGGQALSRLFSTHPSTQDRIERLLGENSPMPVSGGWRGFAN